MCRAVNTQHIFRFMKQTKIVASVSDLRCEVEFIKELYEAGANVIRMNTAHATPDGLRKIIRNVRAVSPHLGIMIDTKNFTFKTGVRTFEAAAYLRRCGVDIIRVKKWFQSDLASFNTIADIVKNAEIVNDTIAISIYDKTSKEANLICAKAADELLTISDITASFVLGNNGEKICISGRSIGDINVQVILEKLRRWRTYNTSRCSS